MEDRRYAAARKIYWQNTSGQWCSLEPSTPATAPIWCSHIPGLTGSSCKVSILMASYTLKYYNLPRRSSNQLTQAWYMRGGSQLYFGRRELPAGAVRVPQACRSVISAISEGGQVRGGPSPAGSPAEKTLNTIAKQVPKPTVNKTKNTKKRKSRTRDPPTQNCAFVIREEGG